MCVCVCVCVCVHSGKEKVALFMSDSTNVLAPGRTISEQVVSDSIVQKVR